LSLSESITGFGTTAAAQQVPVTVRGRRRGEAGVAPDPRPWKSS